MFWYEAGHEFGGEPPVSELGEVEFVPGEPERKERPNKSAGLNAERSGDAATPEFGLNAGLELRTGALVHSDGQ